MKNNTRCQLFLASFSAALVFASTTPSLADDVIDFERDISPIFENRCIDCHGEDEQESGFRLDLRSGLLRGGDSGISAIVPGNPSDSYLLDVVKHLDPVIAMPPDEDQIPQDEIDLLTKWIQQGAKIPGQMNASGREAEVKHWAFKQVMRPQLPVMNSSTGSIDAFLLRKLNANGLAYSDPADARSLLRRTCIVLTGLPPTPTETDDFLQAWEQDSDWAFENLVDKLLDSPHFGERWAQHWLDVIRWAETNGSEANLYRKNAWVYRDYVVRSFNEDKPYDQFIREQIAGDSLGAGEATGFLVSGPHVPAATVGREPTAIRQARADRLDEVLQTVGASLMGVTIGCARCHNHKFDPITIQDYYSMTAVFQDVEFGSRRPEYSPEHPLRKRGQELRGNISILRNQLAELGGWEENWGAYREYHFKPIKTKAVRIQFKTKAVALDELEVLGPEGANKNLALRDRGTALNGFPELGNEERNPLDRVNDGQYGTMAWRAKVDEKSGGKSTGSKPWVQFDFELPETINRLRLSSNREYFYDTDYLSKRPSLPRYQFDVSIQRDDGSWQPWTGTWAVTTKLNSEHPERKAILDTLQTEVANLGEQGPRPSFVGRFVPAKTTFVFLRGSPESPRGEVLPAGPAVFAGDLGLSANSPGARRRAEFAKWVSSPENPLTARVMVNRVWHHVFGTGIVATTSDFGTAGAPPSHQKLLDLLAAEFVEPSDQGPNSLRKPWSVKRLVRSLVMTQAFRQSSSPTELGNRADSANRLLWRYPPKRVEAEVIRDSILLASDSLDRKSGGKSYRIHNEKATYAQWEVVDNSGPRTWRRMLYQERMRRVDDQMFTAFDFPDCGQVRAKRPVSTTPLQALNLLNSKFVIDQSDRIAARALREVPSDFDASVNRCFELILGRPATQGELSDATSVAETHSLAILCRALINSNEFAFIP